MNRPLTGLKAWAVQRVSAAVLVMLLIYGAGALPFLHSGTGEAWRVLVASPAVMVSLALGALVLGLHAWVGVRDVVLDYVHHAGTRLAILVLVLLALGAQGFWFLFILARVA